MRATLITLVTLAVLVAGGFALTLIRPVPLPRTIEVVPPVSSKLVCPSMAGAGTLLVDGADSIGVLGGDEVAATGPVVMAEQQVPAVIRGGSSMLGGVAASGSGTRAWVPCGPPLSRGTLLVPSAAGTDLLLVNPDASEAVVDLSLYGPEGELVALGARGIAIGPFSSRTIALSVLVPTDGPVGVEYNASRGRATVVARTDAPGVLEAAAASTPGTEHWLPGIAEGATDASLLVTNPGTDRATVQVTALGATAAYQPEGGADISVPPHTTVAVELASSLAGEATGLHVTSDVDVAAGLSTSTGTGADRAFTAPVSASTQLGAFVPDSGVLQVTNPGDADTRVSVTTGTAGGVEAQATVEEYGIPAGTTLVIPLMAADPDAPVVSVTAVNDVFGAVVDTTNGVTIAPLSSTADLPSTPIDAEIVPTLR